MQSTRTVGLKTKTKTTALSKSLAKRKKDARIPHRRGCCRSRPAGRNVLVSRSESVKSGCRFRCKSRC
eukprot:2459442-Alexandrium_andersonii.AAC.1